jgi:hypothetical protein
MMSISHDEQQQQSPHLISSHLIASFETMRLARASREQHYCIKTLLRRLKRMDAGDEMRSETLSINTNSISNSSLVASHDASRGAMKIDMRVCFHVIHTDISR